MSARAESTLPRCDVIERATTYVLLTGGMALFGSATPVSKIVGDAFPTMLASGMRMATALLVLVPWLLLGDSLGRVADVGAGDRVRLVAIALVGTFGFTVLLVEGLRHAPGTVASVVMATTPAVTALGAVAFLGSRLDRLTAGAIVLAVAGVGVANLGGTSSGATAVAALLGSVLVLGAVCCEAAYTLLGKRLGADLSPVAIATAAAALAGVAFAPLATWQAIGADWSGPAWTDWLALAWWGAGTMGVGSVVWFSGVRRASGTTASGFMAVMPISALVLSYVLLDEGFEWFHVPAMAAVLTAVGTLTYRDARPGADAS